MPTLQQALSRLNTGPLMPFGKFKGAPLAELSDEYLLWLACLDDLRQPLLGAVLREMGARLAERPSGESVVRA